MAASSVALADNIITDGDGVTPLTSGQGVAFGNVCKDATPHPQKTVLLAVSAAGHPGAGTNVYANSATVTISTSSVSSGLGASGGSINLPSNWTTLGNGTQSSTISPTVTLDPSSLPLGAYSGSITYDASGARSTGGTPLTRSATVSVSATIQSCNTAPSLNLPADITAEASGPGGAVVIYSATATDAEDNPDPSPICTPSSGSTFPLGSTTVNCSVTDSGNATTNGSFKVIVKDTTGPVLALANLTEEATGPLGAAVTFSTSASDAVDGTVAVVCDKTSGDTFPLGTTTVNCSASDGAGNPTTGSFTIKVVDTTAPALTLPANIGGVEATGPSGAVVNFTASATDVVDGSVPVTCNQASGSTFAIGTTTVTCSATDAHSNNAGGSFTVQVQDTTGPVIAPLADITAEATSAAGAVVNYTSPATSDAVDGGGTATCSPSSGSTFALGDTTVTCNASDDAGNAATPTTFKVTVQDTTAPVIAAHADVTAEATSAAGAAVTYTAPATSDAVDGPGTATCAPAAGSTFALGNTTVTCNASDDAGNAASPTTFKVTVQDTTGPTLLLPAAITKEATGPSGAAATFSNSAIDLVDGSVPVLCDANSGDTFALGTTTVSCSATDAHTNKTNGSFTVTVQDTTAPTLTLPANIVTTATSATGAVVNFTATATDIVDGSVPVTCNPASGSAFPIGATTVSCSAMDAQGNTANGSFTVSVVYNWTGYFQPVDNPTVWNVPSHWNTAKAGSAIPVKFNLGGYQGLNILNAGWPKATGVTCPGSSVPVDPIEELVTAGGSSLTYDTVAQQYVYVWKSDKTKMAGNCYRFDLGLKDGTNHSFFIQFTR